VIRKVTDYPYIRLFNWLWPGRPELDDRRRQKSISLSPRLDHNWDPPCLQFNGKRLLFSGC